MPDQRLFGVAETFPLWASVWSAGRPGPGGGLPLSTWQPVQSTFGRLPVSTWQEAQAVAMDWPPTVTLPRYACESVEAIGKKPAWFCAAMAGSTPPVAWQGKHVLLYVAVSRLGSGWYPGTGVLTLAWIASRCCANGPGGE